MPLSCGKFDGATIECCYHGWQFNTQGICTSVPSLADSKQSDLSRIKTGHFECREINGVIWIFIRQNLSTALVAPAPPSILDHDATFYWVDSVTLSADVDNAVIGLIDPAHGPFVHRSWFWRSGKSAQLKVKNFVPDGFGFKMTSHRPSSNSRAYRILGGNKQTEISFELPGLRTERITVGKHSIVLFTALTPVDAQTTRLHQFMFTSIPALNLARRLLLPFGRKFIHQDVTVFARQQQGLQGEHPPTLLFGDADAQARWYYKLKNEFKQAQLEGRKFENRLKARVLRWRT